MTKKKVNCHEKHDDMICEVYRRYRDPQMSPFEKQIALKIALINVRDISFVLPE